MSLLCVASGGGPWPLHDTAASRGAEARALAASAPHALMQRSGLGVARLALALAPNARRIDVHAGPGNNGGDGLVAATQLRRAGHAVRVLLWADAARLPPDAAQALLAARAAGVLILDRPAPGQTRCDEAAADLTIDALLGFATARAPQAAVAQAIACINASRAPVLAVDVPSGLHADTGRVLGVAVRASATLSLLTLKPGLFTADGRDHAGAVWFDALDTGGDGADATAQLAALPAAVQGGRRHASHKGSFGDVAVVGGAAGMTGAAWLAARAALAAGAGRVYCSLLEAQAPLLDPARPELMGREHWWTTAPAVMLATTVLCGCGGGDAVATALPALLSNAGRLVLDADALNAIAADPGLQRLLKARAGRGRPTLLTPHPLEAARLLGIDAAAVQHDRLAAATGLAERYAAVALLKGSGSIVAAPARLPSINPTGNAWLASAGTGDVLAGWITGLWAQLGGNADSARDAAIAGVWQHGRAADRAAAAGLPPPLRAADLIEAMRAC